jgi:hypothetical protein
MGHGLPRQTHSAHETHTKRPIPILIGKFHKLAGRGPSCIRNYNVKPSEAFNGLAHEFADIFRFAHVCDDGKNLTAVFFSNRPGSCIESTLTARADADLRALASQSESRGFSYSLASSRNHSHFSLQAHIHL